MGAQSGREERLREMMDAELRRALIWNDIFDSIGGNPAADRGRGARALADSPLHTPCPDMIVATVIEERK